LEHLEAGILLQEQAVLFRAAHHSDLLEVALTRHEIPFVKYGGLKFLEAAHVKDLLALLRVLENPYDELAWTRVLRWPEGMGPARAARLLVDLGVRPRDPEVEPLTRFQAVTRHVPASARDEVGALAAALEECRVPDMTAAAQVGRLRVVLDPIVRRRYDHAESRVADLDQLEALAGAHQDRARLVADLVLDPPAGTGDLAGPPHLDEDFLTLSTVHSAKGCEWDVVHVIHAADGMFPSDMATRSPSEIDEERRLFYVALTRARDHLEVSFPLRYFHHRHGLADTHNYAQLTRFLPTETHHLLDRSATTGDTVVWATSDGSPRATGSLGEDVDRGLHALWG
jgi:DNA helicase-2/ATP-dependent DNA helicase PcrA